MLNVLLITLFVLVCFLLIVVVLLQSGKGGGISGAFGIGQASQTIFGAGGAGNVLTKSTSILGGVFMVLALLMAILSRSGPGTTRRSVLQEAVGTAPAAAPVTPGATPSSTLPAPAGSTPAAAAPDAGSLPAPATGTTGGTGGGTGN
jgi:preprotein translocase subunit SecG